jgi:small GTP-binding protein
MAESENHPYNIAFIGPVSAGKSTLVNAILSDTYSDMKLRRTTMTPQLYREATDQAETWTAREAREANRTTNDWVMSARTSGAPVKLDQIEYFPIKPVQDFYQLTKGLAYQFWDIPGLNDQGSEIYFQFIEKSFIQFDLVFLVFDITSGLNRTDELEVLRRVLDLLVKNRHTSLIVVANKCDDLYFTGDVAKFDDEEIQELYQQMLQTMSREIDARDPSLKHRSTILPLSGELLYIYRTFKNNPQCQLDEKYIDKLAHNEIGKVQWNRRCKDITGDARQAKIEYARDLLKKANLSESIHNTGFGSILRCLKTRLTQGHMEQVLLTKYSEAIGLTTLVYDLDNLACLSQRLGRLLALVPSKRDHLQQTMHKFASGLIHTLDSVVLSPTDVEKYRLKISEVRGSMPWLDPGTVALLTRDLTKHYYRMTERLLASALTRMIPLESLAALKSNYPGVTAQVTEHLAKTEIKVSNSCPSSSELGFLESLQEHFPDVDYPRFAQRFLRAKLLAVTADQYNLARVYILANLYRCRQKELASLMNLRPGPMEFGGAGAIPLTISYLIDEQLGPDYRSLEARVSELEKTSATILSFLKI